MGRSHPINGPGTATFPGQPGCPAPKRATSEAIWVSAAVLLSTPSGPVSAIRPCSPSSMLAVSISTLTDGLAYPQNGDELRPLAV
jgi:hypothetical protein